MFTFFHCTIHFTVFPQTDSIIFCSAVFGVISRAIFCHPLNAHAIARFPHAQLATSTGSIFHSDAIPYLAPASPHSSATCAGLASFHSLEIIHTLFGHTKVAPISVIVSHTFAPVDSGLKAPYFCTNSFPVCHAVASCSAHAFCSSRSCQYVLSDSPAFIAVPITFHGRYCPAFVIKEAASHATFGTSETTHPTKLNKGLSTDSPYTFCFCSCFLFEINSNAACGSSHFCFACLKNSISLSSNQNFAFICSAAGFFTGSGVLANILATHCVALKRGLCVVSTTSSYPGARVLATFAGVTGACGCT